MAYRLIVAGMGKRGGKFGSAPEAPKGSAEMAEMLIDD
jgi:hypothetical protein